MTKKADKVLADKALLDGVLAKGVSWMGALTDDMAELLNQDIAEEDVQDVVDKILERHGIGVEDWLA